MLRAGYLLRQFGQIAGAGADAFLRIEAVLDAQIIGRVLGKHHHAAHVGIRGGQGVPFGFLVGQGRQQAPVDSGQVLRGLKVVAPVGELGAGVVDEPGDAGRIEALDVAEVAVMDARQRAVGADAGDEGVGLVAQGSGILAAEGPAELQPAWQFQQGAEFRMEVDAQVKVDFMYRDQLRLAFGDAGQQVHFGDARNFDDLRARFFVQPAQDGRQRRARHHLDRLPGQVGKLLRSQHLVVADDPLLDAADRGRVLQSAVPERHRGGKVHPAGQRQVVQLVRVGGLDEMHLEAEAVSEGGDQVVLETAGRAAFAFLEESRGFADGHDQPAVVFGWLDAAAGGQAARDQAADKAKQFRQRFSSRACCERRPLRGYNPRLAERWQSGRMYLTRNQAMSQGIRGFESHPLRHLTLSPKGFRATLDLYPSLYPSSGLMRSAT